MRWRRCVPLCLAIAASISPLYLVPLREHVSSGRHPHESLEDENDTETLEDEEVGEGKNAVKERFFLCRFFSGRE